MVIRQPLVRFVPVLGECVLLVAAAVLLLLLGKVASPGKAGGLGVGLGAWKRPDVADGDVDHLVELVRRRLVGLGEQTEDDVRGGGELDPPVSNG